VAGLKSAASYSTACNHGAGDDGSNPAGTGCSAADLCAPGWHVCSSAADVLSSAGNTNPCSNAALFDAQSFFATRQSGSGNAACNAAGNNDLFGCGTLGDPVSSGTCSPLNRFSDSGCSSLGAAWGCGTPNTANVTEALTVTKSGASRGGVLCCVDLAP